MKPLCNFQTCFLFETSPAKSEKGWECETIKAFRFGNDIR